MAIRELITDETTGHLSATKMWQHLGNAAMTFGFLKVVWTSGATEGLAWLFAVFGGLVAGSQVASKFLGLKYGAPKANGNGNGAPAPGGAKP